MRPEDTTLGGPRRDFPATAWDVISRALNSSTAVRRAGLEELCARYWKPVYYYVRVGWAKSNEDAKDLTQAFLLWLVEGSALRRYLPERASFRTYLKSLLKHFLQHEGEWAGRRKRGGAVRFMNVDDHLYEIRSRPDPASFEHDPDRAFDREWLEGLLARAVDRVRERCLPDERQAFRFRVFEAYDLCSPELRPTYAALAARLGLRESDVRNYLFAVREEVRAEARSEMSTLTADGEALEREWNEFFGP